MIAACYDAQGNTQHVDEAILPTEDHISERIVCAVLLMGGQSARVPIDGCTHCASEVSLGFLLHVRPLVVGVNIRIAQFLHKTNDGREILFCAAGRFRRFAETFHSAS